MFHTCPEILSAAGFSKRGRVAPLSCSLRSPAYQRERPRKLSFRQAEQFAPQSSRAYFSGGPNGEGIVGCGWVLPLKYRLKIHLTTTNTIAKPIAWPKTTQRKDMQLMWTLPQT